MLSARKKLPALVQRLKLQQFHFSVCEPKKLPSEGEHLKF